MSFVEIDDLFETERVGEGYNMLLKRLNGGEADCEVLWRLARACHEKACLASKQTRKDLIFEGRDFACRAYEMNETNFEAVKWAAVLSGQSTDYLGTKEKIVEGGRFKDLLDVALKVQPEEFSLLHLRGRFSHTLANLSWLEKKAASMIYSELPKATIDDALADFEAAYSLSSDWIENLFYLAKCHYSKGNKKDAKKYFAEALELQPTTQTEQELLEEATHLINKC